MSRVFNHFGEEKNVKSFRLKYNNRITIVKVINEFDQVEIWNFERFLYYNPLEWEELIG